jgi:hypothetical protein
MVSTAPPTAEASKNKPTFASQRLAGTFASQRLAGWPTDTHAYVDRRERAASRSLRDPQPYAGVVRFRRSSSRRTFPENTRDERAVPIRRAIDDEPLGRQGVRPSPPFADKDGR